MSAKDTTGLVPQTVEYIVRADRPRSLDPRDPQTPALADVARSDMVLYEITSSRTLDVSEQIATAGLDRTIDGASTLRVSLIDKTDTLIRHPLLRRNSQGLWRTRVVLDSIVFHLVNVSRPAARRVDLTFEEQAYNALRRHDNPLVGSRGKYTRAQFIKRMTDEAGIELISPEINVKQRVAEAEQPDTAGTAGTAISTSDRRREPGFANHAAITIKGQAANAEQRANLALSLSIARALGAGPLATLAMVTSGIGESNWLKGATDGVTGTHVGVFQSNQIPASDLKAQTIHFLQGGRSFLAGGAIGYAKAHPDATPGTIASKVEISDGNGAFYDKYADEARRIIAVYTGGSADLSDADTAGVLSNDADDTYAVPYEFSRGDDGQREDSVTCIRRLADEVAWYFFIVAATAYYVSGNYLIRSRPRMLVAPGEEGIEEVTFSLDESAKVEDQVTVQCRARRWQAPPGSVVDVDGYGDADGRWLVGQISRPKLFTSDLATVTLVRAKKKKPEPAHEVRQRESDDITGTLDADGGAFDTSGASVGRVSSLSGTPAHIINSLVLPLARKNHMQTGITVEGVAAANARHGPTVNKTRSDHQGPPEYAWAADMSNGGSPTPQMDQLANDIADLFGMQRLNMSTSGAAGSLQTSATTINGYRIQLIYRSYTGGNHDNHVHCGIRKG